MVIAVNIIFIALFILLLVIIKNNAIGKKIDIIIKILSILSIAFMFFISITEYVKLLIYLPHFIRIIIAVVYLVSIFYILYNFLEFYKSKSFLNYNPKFLKASIYVAFTICILLFGLSGSYQFINTFLLILIVMSLNDFDIFNTKDKIYLFLISLITILLHIIWTIEFLFYEISMSFSLVIGIFYCLAFLLFSKKQYYLKIISSLMFIIFCPVLGVILYSTIHNIRDHDTSMMKALGSPLIFGFSAYYIIYLISNFKRKFNFNINQSTTLD